jgi:hypothetical protein
MLYIHKEGYISEDELIFVLPSHERLAGPSAQFVAFDPETDLYRVLKPLPTIREWVDICCSYYAFPTEEVPEKIRSALAEIETRNMYPGPVSPHSFYYRETVLRLTAIHEGIMKTAAASCFEELSGRTIATLPFLPEKSLMDSYHDLVNFFDCILDKLERGLKQHAALRRMRRAAKKAERFCEIRGI